MPDTVAGRACKGLVVTSTQECGLGTAFRGGEGDAT